MGDPIVCECRTPATISARSVSIFIRPPRPYPCCRRHSSRLTASREIGMPAGIPARVATRHSPCDSPAVSNRSIGRRFYGNRLKQTEGLVRKGLVMVKFLLWCILLILCWPIALAALVLFPIVWLLLLPFRVVGIAVGGALDLVWAIVTLPARIVRAIV